MLKSLAIHLIVLISAASVSAQTARESFNYSPAGADLNGNMGNGSVGMSGAWVGDATFDIGAGNLTNPTGTIEVTGNRVTAASFNDNREVARFFTEAFGIDNTTAYFSFLMRPEGVIGGGAFGGWFGIALRGNVNDVFVGKPTEQSLYVMERPGGANRVLTTKTTAVGESTLFAMRVDFLPGNDNIRLYVNPTPGGSEPLTPSAMISAFDLGLLISARLTGPGAFSFDELRAGSTFASVMAVMKPGDFNLDGHLDANDISPMMAALTNPSAYKASNFVTDPQLSHIGDINGDHKASNADLQALLDQLKSGGGSANAVPEPASIAIVVIGLPGFGIAVARRLRLNLPRSLRRCQSCN